MRWRVLTAVGLILVLLAGGTLCRNAVADSCREVEAVLRRAGEAVQPEDLAQAQTLWERRLPLISCVLTHDRLERVGEGLARAEGSLRAGERADCLAQVRAVLYLLEDIRNYDRVNFQTLL